MVLNNSDGGNFECSICLDLAQDSIVTLCGHLFCRPCFYRWLHMHSHSYECPICKAFIEEEKLVPLYGRGRYSTETRSKPGANIPKCSAAQRPESPPQQDRNVIVQHGSGFIGGFGPAISASFGNFTLSFGGFIPSIFNVQMHTLNYGGDHHGYEARPHIDRHHEVSLLLIISLIFLFALVWE